MRPGWVILCEVIEEILRLFDLLSSWGQVPEASPSASPGAKLLFALGRDHSPTRFRAARPPSKQFWL